MRVVLSDGSDVPLDPAKTYTLASQSYLIKYGADGLNLFVDNMLTLYKGMPDYQVILTYIVEELGGTIDSTYASPQGRIRSE